MNQANTPTPVRPQIGDGVYIAPTAYVCGDVTIGDESTIMHHVVIRGDVAAIRIGRRVNVQDQTMIHVKTGVPQIIEDEVAIGHRAVVHAKHIASKALIGIGAIVLDDCEVGAGAIIGAGAVLPPGTIVPAGKLVIGVPGRVVRDVSEQERHYVDFILDSYARLNHEHAAGMYPNWNE